MSVAARKFCGSARGPVGAFLLITVFFSCLLLTGCGGDVSTASAPVVPPPAPVTPPPAPVVPHVVIVVLENKNYNQVIGSSYMPFLNSLATKYALATNFYANGIDSLPNYFMMTVGSTITTGSTYNAVVNDNNVVRVLTTAGKSWKAYAESIPSVGYLGPSQPPYVKVHNPFAYFSDIVNDAEAAKNIVGMDQFATDLAAGKLPNYAFVIPNNSSNSHDCPPTMTTCTSADTLKYSDDWLKAHVQPLIDSDSWPSTLLIVTYDESAGDTTNGGGRVVTVVAGTKVNSGYQITTMMQHEAILRLSLKALGLTDLPGQAATAPDMDGAFKTALPLP